MIETSEMEDIRKLLAENVSPVRRIARKPVDAICRRPLSSKDRFKNAHPNDEVGAEVVLHMKYVW